MYLVRIIPGTVCTTRYLVPGTYVYRETTKRNSGGVPGPRKTLVLVASSSYTVQMLPVVESTDIYGAGYWEYWQHFRFGYSHTSYLEYYNTPVLQNPQQHY